MIFKVGDKVIGTMEKGVFKKKVNYEKHHLHNYSAWAIDYTIVQNLKELKCETILIITDTGREFKIQFQEFIKNCFKIEHGYGAQMACSDKHWNDSNLKALKRINKFLNGYDSQKKLQQLKLF